MIRRTLMLWLGLLALPFLLHCTPEGQALPPLQTVALDADPGELGRFEGRWFDALDGYLMAVVRGGEGPLLSVRLSDTLHLEAASLQGDQLRVRFRGETGAGAYSLLSVETMSWSWSRRAGGPPGAAPAPLHWCGTGRSGESHTSGRVSHVARSRSNMDDAIKPSITVPYVSARSMSSYW